MGSVGDAYDNAMAESFFCPLERELLDRRRFKESGDQDGCVQANGSKVGITLIDIKHSSLGYRSPVNYERAHRWLTKARASTAFGSRLRL